MRLYIRIQHQSLWICFRFSGGGIFLFQIYIIFVYILLYYINLYNTYRTLSLVSKSNSLDYPSDTCGVAYSSFFALSTLLIKDIAHKRILHIDCIRSKLPKEWIREFDMRMHIKKLLSKSLCVGGAADFKHYSHIPQ